VLLPIVGYISELDRVGTFKDFSHQLSKQGGKYITILIGKVLITLI
jgi:hypothetical protein